jgi:protein subunit release factor B
VDTGHLKNEVEIYFYRSRGPGGQRKNKRETAVRIRHLPTGLTVVATEHRSQAQNRELAFRRLVEKLRKLHTRPKKRIPTAKPASVRERELAEKRRHSEKKQLRQKNRVIPD